MFSFQVETLLDEDIRGEDLLTMQSVNYELHPIVKMTSPIAFKTKNLQFWPINVEAFTSVILLFCFVPVDRHKFKLVRADETGFEESSTTIFHKEWRHCRSIKHLDSNSLVTDTLTFVPKLKFIGHLTLPIYRSLFRYRHKRLAAKYGGSTSP
ncbi:hypothetical protein [Marinomonas sp. PE14-40]|uniref:hypothetical protein n=1 Tax=Marinomonas sp. PE14-40 TaxID=3060621 RepID=UPI003F67ABB7